MEALIDQAPVHSPPISASTSNAPNTTTSLSSSRSTGMTPIRNPFARSASSSVTPSPDPSGSASSLNPQLPMIGTMPLPTNEELMAICHTFIDKMRRRVASWVLERMDQMYGPVPNDPAGLSYWMALVRYLIYATSISFVCLLWFHSSCSACHNLASRSELT